MLVLYYFLNLRVFHKAFNELLMNYYMWVQGNSFDADLLQENAGAFGDGQWSVEWPPHSCPT